MTTLRINLGENSYDITVGKNLLLNAENYLNLNRKVLVVTDSGVPASYAKTICEKAKIGKVLTVEQGETSKSFDTLQTVLKAMRDLKMDRKDCVVAVGGGVVGDLAGFASSVYMRGVDFYNVPTTVLSQVDSSIGGKTAINFDGIKNIIGAFYQPKAVLVDTSLLSSLPKRQISNGLAEAVKMSLTSDEKLFEKFEKYSYEEILRNLEEIIIASLQIKKDIVEKDEKETGLRRILNFGHTFGHAVESQTDMQQFYHGECVAIGMIPVCSNQVRLRLLPVLQKLNLPSTCACNVDKALEFVKMDKKSDGDTVNVVFVDKVGEFKIEKTSNSDFAKKVKSIF